jgi:lipoprotein-releasing system ATP-binding protein
LDIATADAVFAVMRKIITELNLSAIIATHNPDLVRKMDRVLKIVDGKII